MLFKASFSHVTIVGRLGRDPEVRYMPQSNQAVAKFSIATTEAWQSQSGEKKERTDWHTIEVIGKTAEFCEKYLRKGKMVLVEGRLRYDQWTDKDGQKKTFTKVAASSVTVLEKRDKDPMDDVVGEVAPGDDADDQELPF